MGELALKDQHLQQAESMVASALARAGAEQNLQAAQNKTKTLKQELAKPRATGALVVNGAINGAGETELRTSSVDLRSKLQDAESKIVSLEQQLTDLRVSGETFTRMASMISCDPPK